jgi:hypothetical protein
MKIVLILVSLLAFTAPSEAACFLFFCSHHYHHHRVHHRLHHKLRHIVHHRVHPRVVRAPVDPPRTIVIEKDITKEVKPAPPTVDPIAPVK